MLYTLKKQQGSTCKKNSNYSQYLNKILNSLNFFLPQIRVTLDYCVYILNNS